LGGKGQGAGKVGEKNVDYQWTIAIKEILRIFQASQQSSAHRAAVRYFCVQQLAYTEKQFRYKHLMPDAQMPAHSGLETSELTGKGFI